MSGGTQKTGEGGGHADVAPSPDDLIWQRLLAGRSFDFALPEPPAVATAAPVVAPAAVATAETAPVASPLPELPAPLADPPRSEPTPPTRARAIEAEPEPTVSAAIEEVAAADQTSSSSALGAPSDDTGEIDWLASFASDERRQADQQELQQLIAGPTVITPSSFLAAEEPVTAAVA